MPHQDTIILSPLYLIFYGSVTLVTDWEHFVIEVADELINIQLLRKQTTAFMSALCVGSRRKD